MRGRFPRWSLCSRSFPCASAIPRCFELFENSAIWKQTHYELMTLAVRGAHEPPRLRQIDLLGMSPLAHPKQVDYECARAPKTSIFTSFCLPTISHLSSQVLNFQCAVLIMNSRAGTISSQKMSTELPRRAISCPRDARSRPRERRIEVRQRLPPASCDDCADEKTEPAVGEASSRAEPPRGIIVSRNQRERCSESCGRPRRAAAVASTEAGLRPNGAISNSPVQRTGKVCYDQIARLVVVPAFF